MLLTSSFSSLFLNIILTSKWWCSQVSNIYLLTFRFCTEHQIGRWRMNTKCLILHSIQRIQETGKKSNCRGFYFMLQVNKPDFVMFVLFLYKDQVTENTGWIDGDLFCSSTSLVCFLNVNVISLAGFAHRCVALTQWIIGYCKWIISMWWLTG